jgi:sortase (surface protein transpeptidase)
MRCAAAAGAVLACTVPLAVACAPVASTSPESVSRADGRGDDPPGSAATQAGAVSAGSSPSGAGSTMAATDHARVGEEALSGRGDDVAVPVAIRIPAIGVDAEVVAVGLEADRSMEVPDFGLAGWYAEGPRPGAPGPAVIVGHYDSKSGPDVFHELDALEPGDEIHVIGERGTQATFVVEWREQQPKDELPGDRIWASSSHPRLTLVTCGGVFDRSTGHYLDNVIVYAVGT